MGRTNILRRALELSCKGSSLCDDSDKMVQPCTGRCQEEETAGNKTEKTDCGRKEERHFLLWFLK